LTDWVNGLNLTNLTDWVNGLNLTNLTKVVDDLVGLFNLSSLVDGLNLTGLDDLTNLTKVVDDLVGLFNLSSLVDGLNLTNLTNLTDWVNGLNLTNLTDWINNFNWTNIIGGNDTAKDTAKDNDTGFDWKNIFDWDSIFGGKDKENSIETIITVVDQFSRQANDYYAGERGAMFYATLTDINGKPLVNKTVQIAVAGPIYNVTTDELGRAGLQVNFLAANTYTYALSFKGDDQYKASPLASTKLTVTKKKTTISASSKKFKAKAKTKTISVTLKTVKNPYDGKTYLKSGKKITLKVNGKTYTAKINAKGVAKFKIKLTKKGKYTAAISFKGDNTYQASSKKISIQIK
ncbi:MAG: Ig-like domain repeat protein, partial [Methanosphaera sp.]|nr:Ig-like domain repeat protein [Methanosphaera sp.]